MFSKKNLKYYMWAIVIGIGVCLGHRIFFFIFMGFAEQSVQDIGKTVMMDQAVFLATVLGVLYETLLGPVTEELIFRGIIFPVARQKRGNLYAVIVSSILFALAHFNGVQFIAALFMGVVIGYTVFLTGNIYIGVVIHVVNNSFSVINVNFLNKFLRLNYNQTLMQVFGGCILLLFGILMLRHEVGKELRLER